MLVRFFALMLTLALGSAAVAADRPPADTVSGLYAHYLAATKLGPKGRFEAKPYLLPSFYALIASANARQDSCFKAKGTRCLVIDWDIYDGAQVELYAYVVEAAKTTITGTSAIVPVKLTYERNGTAGPTDTMLVQLTKTADGWRVADLLPPDPSSPTKTYSTRATIQRALDSAP
jgi:hypothetical protein